MCWGPTHWSCALGIEPSRPLPAVPLLEHAASCKELLVGGYSKQTQARRTPRAGQGARTRHLTHQGAKDKELPALGPGTRAQALSPAPGLPRHPGCPP